MIVYFYSGQQTESKEKWGKKSCPQPSRFIQIFSFLVSPSGMCLQFSLPQLPPSPHNLCLEAHIEPHITVIFGFALLPIDCSEPGVGIIWILESLSGSG